MVSFVSNAVSPEAFFLLADEYRFMKHGAKVRLSFPGEGACFFRGLNVRI
jgi:hypothetical protein